LKGSGEVDRGCLLPRVRRGVREGVGGRILLCFLWWVVLFCHSCVCPLLILRSFIRYPSLSLSLFPSLVFLRRVFSHVRQGGVG